MVGIAVERISGHSDAESAAWHPEFCLSPRCSELAVGVWLEGCGVRRVFVVEDSAGEPVDRIDDPPNSVA
jgi:hypothetical protein